VLSGAGGPCRNVIRRYGEDKCLKTPMEKAFGGPDPSHNNGTMLRKIRDFEEKNPPISPLDSRYLPGGA
jgi:hypothetical protein